MSAAATPLTACTKCGHNMGRSKCRPTGKTYRGWPTWIVRCGKCRTEHLCRVVKKRRTEAA